MKIDYYKILGLTKTCTPEDIKDSFRELAKKYHPDVCKKNKKEAAEKFREINEAYTILSDSDKRNLYDNPPKEETLIKSKLDTYVVGRRFATGDISDIFEGKNGDNQSVLIKICKNPKNNDLLAAEAINLKKIFSSKFHKNPEIRLPKLIDNFTVSHSSKNLAVSIFAYRPGYHTWKELENKFADGMNLRDFSWMINRVLESFIISHGAGIVHGAPVLSHLLFSPENPEVHGGLLVDWCYSVKEGEKIKAIIPEYKDYYPSEVLNKQPANFSTDLFIFAKSVLALIPKNDKVDSVTFKNFFETCLWKQKVRPQNAESLREDFKKMLVRLYGEPKFRPFKI